MEIYVDFPTWEWAVVLRNKKLVLFDSILITQLTLKIFYFLLFLKIFITYVA